MFVGLNEQKDRVLSLSCENDQTVYCPACLSPVTMDREGQLKFFLHPEESDCELAYANDPLQRNIRFDLWYSYARSNLFTDIKLEANLPGAMADVMVTTGRGENIAILVQTDQIDLEDFKGITEELSGNDFHTLWLFGGQPQMDDAFSLFEDETSDLGHTRVGEVEQTSHFWNFGRIYYWFNKNIYAVHLTPTESGNVAPKGEDDDGIFRFPKSFTSRKVSRKSLVTVDRTDGIRVARFRDHRWWK